MGRDAGSRSCEDRNDERTRRGERESPRPRSAEHHPGQRPQGWVGARLWGPHPGDACGVPTVGHRAVTRNVLRNVEWTQAAGAASSESPPAVRTQRRRRHLLTLLSQCVPITPKSVSSADSALLTGTECLTHVTLTLGWGLLRSHFMDEETGHRAIRVTQPVTDKWAAGTEPAGTGQVASVLIQERAREGSQGASGEAKLPREASWGRQVTGKAVPLLQVGTKGLSHLRPPRSTEEGGLVWG